MLSYSRHVWRHRILVLEYEFGMFVIAELLALVWLKLFLYSERQIELPACTNEVRIQMILDGKYNIIRRYLLENMQSMRKGYHARNNVQTMHLDNSDFLNKCPLLF